MDPDWPLYAACAIGAALGSFLALRKKRDSESRVVLPWLMWSLILALVLFAVLRITSAASDEARSGWWARQEMIGCVFAYGFLLQVILTLSGIVIGIGRLGLKAHSAREDLA